MAIKFYSTANVSNTKKMISVPIVKSPTNITIAILIENN